MDPLTALGVASNVIQIVDFSSRLLSRTQEIYRSQDGLLQDHVILDDAAKNLWELMKDLQGIQVPKSKQRTAADEQLVKLRADCKTVALELRKLLEEAKVQGSNRKWQSIYQAVKSVYSENQIAVLQSKLDSIRRHLDTVLLVTIRQNINKISPDSNRESGVDPSAILDAKERHEELLRTIRKRNWKSGSRKHVAEFSDELRLVTDADLEVRFCRIILARLYFPQMHHRSKNISNAYSSTFEWIFQEHAQTQNQPLWDSLPKWLQRENSSIYWITGKPGSGKSTMMKFLCENPRLSELIENWARGSKLTNASFYFWNSGVDDMQMSQIGLLHTLLYLCLQNNRTLILSVFKERWEQYIAFGGGIDLFEWPELHSAFKKLIADESKKFFFLIDGLDEFEGNPAEIIQFVLDAARPNVKICTASRPWNQFEQAFRNRPNIQLEHLTRNDISQYVNSHFNANEYYLQLKKGEPKSATKLVNNIVKKACGVFLWVKLVVNSLLQGLANGDEMSHLQTRLNQLPSDLEDLFEDLLSRLEPEYFKGACQLFRLLRAFREFYRSNRNRISTGEITLLELFFADKEETKGSLTASRKRFKQSEAEEKAERMSRRLNARCRGFLEVNSESPVSNIAEHRISYIHRTAKDFIESKNRWPVVLDATDGFNPDVHLANAFLWYLKKVVAKKTKEYRAAQLRCILHAVHMQSVTNRVQLSYLNEVVDIKSSSGVRALWELYGHKNMSKQGSKTLVAQLTLLLERSTTPRRNELLKICREINREFEWTRAKKEYEELRSIRRYYGRSKTLQMLSAKPEVPPCE